MKRLVVIVLVCALFAGIFTGCGAAEEKKFALEPFDLAWGATQQEAGALLKCVYRTHEKAPGEIYVMNSDNGNGIQAFGATPSVIIYEFNLAEEGSDEPRLGRVTMKYAEEDYNNILAALDSACGERYFEDTQWGTADANVYLFADGFVCIEYSSDPLVNPEKIKAESRDRYIALNGINYGTVQKMASSKYELFKMRWQLSTAEEDYVKVDNTN